MNWSGGSQIKAEKILTEAVVSKDKSEKSNCLQLLTGVDSQLRKQDEILGFFDKNKEDKMYY